MLLPSSAYRSLSHECQHSRGAWVQGLWHCSQCKWPSGFYLTSIREELRNLNSQNSRLQKRTSYAMDLLLEIIEEEDKSQFTVLFTYLDMNLKDCPCWLIKYQIFLFSMPVVNTNLKRFGAQAIKILSWWWIVNLSVSVCDCGLLIAAQLTYPWPSMVSWMSVHHQIWNPMMTTWQDHSPHHLSKHWQKMEWNQSVNCRRFTWTLLASVV